MEPDLKAATRRVTQMMAIPGRSGEEEAVMRFIVDELLAAGLPRPAIRFDATHRKPEARGQVGNLIVKLPAAPGLGAMGQSSDPCAASGAHPRVRGLTHATHAAAGPFKRAPRRLLMAHVDTVPLCVGCKPVRRGAWIRSANPATALGADNRSGAAAILTAAVTLLRANLPHPPLTFLWTIQEEVGLRGVRNMSVAPLGKPTLAFNFDGSTPARLTIGATGAYRLVIDVRGIASHAGVHPELGVSAINIAALAIADLHRDGWLGLVTKGRREGTANVGVVHGGEATNVVTPRVTLHAEVRSHNLRFRDVMLKRMTGAFEKAARRVSNAVGARGSVAFEIRPDYESFRLRSDEPCVRAAAAAVKDVLRREPELAIANGGLDANWMTARGIPTVSLGTGDHAAHTVDEVLNVREYEQACRIALRLAAGWPG